MNQLEKPVFTPNLFWDSDNESFDIDLYSSQVIQRVLEYGQWSDWNKIVNYYSIEKIKETAMNLRSLEETALSFISVITNTPLEQFRCYKLNQSNRQLTTNNR